MAQRKKISKNLNKVFINCPFDTKYVQSLLRPLLFTLLYLGFEPLIASQSGDSGQLRMQKILKLIETSDLSIHDISYVRAKKAGDYYRLNMPFELGVDWGYRHFEKPKKQFLLLEVKRNNASRALSDFSGCDMFSHKNHPETLVRVVRDWLAICTTKKEFPGASSVWDQYNYFNTALRENGIYSDKDVMQMPTAEFIENIHKWINVNSSGVS